MQKFYEILFLANIFCGLNGAQNKTAGDVAREMGPPPPVTYASGTSTTANPASAASSVSKAPTAGTPAGMTVPSGTPAPSSASSANAVSAQGTPAAPAATPSAPVVVAPSAIPVKPTPVPPPASTTANPASAAPSVSKAPTAGTPAGMTVPSGTPAPASAPPAKSVPEKGAPAAPNVPAATGWRPWFSKLSSPETKAVLMAAGGLPTATAQQPAPATAAQEQPFWDGVIDRVAAFLKSDPDAEPGVVAAPLVPMTSRKIYKDLLPGHVAYVAVSPKDTNTLIMRLSNGAVKEIPRADIPLTEELIAHVVQKDFLWGKTGKVPTGLVADIAEINALLSQQGTAGVTIAIAQNNLFRGLSLFGGSPFRVVLTAVPVAATPVPATGAPTSPEATSSTPTEVAPPAQSSVLVTAPAEPSALILPAPAVFTASPRRGGGSRYGGRVRRPRKGSRRSLKRGRRSRGGPRTRY